MMFLKKFAGAEWNPIKSAEFMGKPFGSHKIKITPVPVEWSFDGVRVILEFTLFQAIHLSHMTEDT